MELPNVIILNCFAKRFEYISVLPDVSQARLQVQSGHGFPIGGVYRTTSEMWTVLVKGLEKTIQVLFQMPVSCVMQLRC
jgi:hypothetical protein